MPFDLAMQPCFVVKTQDSGWLELVLFGQKLHVLLLSQYLPMIYQVRAYTIYIL